MIIVRTLQVNNGDCFLVLFPDLNRPQLLVIDSGFASTFRKLEEELHALTEAYNCEIHMILTHIDQDHIGGFKRLFGRANQQFFERIAGFYYNTMEAVQQHVPFASEELLQGSDGIRDNTETSYAQAKTLEESLKARDVLVRTGLWAGGRIDFCEGLSAQILSPSPASLAKYQNWIQREEKRKTAAVPLDYGVPLGDLVNRDFESDDNPVNASSISFLLNAFGHSFLFLGDALSGDVVSALWSLDYSEQHPLLVDLVKVSHHGSRHNTSPELLQLIRGKCFLISGHGGLGHPDKETLARIILSQNHPTLWFNYDIAGDIFTPQELEKYHIQADFGTEWRLE